jgi:uncharacterized protein YndB with AHSA1/START domain
MVHGNRVGKATVTIHALIAKVWDGLVNPALIKTYMAGAEVETDRKEGSPIVWKGEWQGKPFEDKGTIPEIEPERHLKYSHFRPLSGAPDKTVTIDLSKRRAGVTVALAQDHDPSDKAVAASEKDRTMMLEDDRRDSGGATCDRVGPPPAEGPNLETAS